MTKNVHVAIRPAGDGDMERVFAWRNTPEIVRLSQSGREITWEEHCRWFPRAVRAADQRVLIISADGEDMGLIRFEPSDSGLDVTIYVLPGWEGRGIGTAALRAALREYGAGCPCFVARILRDNRRSAAFFAKLGFVSAGERDGVLHYVRENPQAGDGQVPEGGACLQNIVRRFTELVARHGISHRSADWGRQESQLRRLRVFLDLADLEGASVLDVGCGVGEFWQCLRDAGINADYHGVDITPAMVDMARRRFPDLPVAVRDIVAEPCDGEFDYVFASGVFYLLPGEEEVHRIIRAMFRAARRGIAFNSLSAWADGADPSELALDPLRTVAFCRGLSSSVVLRHDYLPHDFTVFLYKDAQ